MRRERRNRRQIKFDTIRNYSSMEAKVNEKAKEIFKRKPYVTLHS